MPAHRKGRWWNDNALSDDNFIRRSSLAQANKATQSDPDAASWRNTDYWKTGSKQANQPIDLGSVKPKLTIALYFIQMVAVILRKNFVVFAW